MKHSNLLWHSIDATTGTRMPGKAARVVTWLAFGVGTHIAAFALGFLLGRV